MQGSASAYLRTLSDHLARLDGAALDRGVGLIREAWLDGRQIITLGKRGERDDSAPLHHRLEDGPLGDRQALPRAVAGRQHGAHHCLCQRHRLRGCLRRAGTYRGRAGRPGSGNSKNVIREVEAANRIGCATLGLCGFDGGRLRKAARHVSGPTFRTCSLARTSTRSSGTSL
jgi:D-sedoheptulose 7-phosphate isomerase